MAYIGQMVHVIPGERDGRGCRPAVVTGRHGDRLDVLVFGKANSYPAFGLHYDHGHGPNTWHRVEGCTHGA